MINPMSNDQPYLVCKSVDISSGTEIQYVDICAMQFAKATSRDNTTLEASKILLI